MRSAVSARLIEIEGPAGPLEAVLEIPEHPGSALAIVCHPHPLHGGTMSNKVVHTLARTFYRLGVAALRFNFRGVGASAGSYAEGEGELEDALAAAHWVLAEGFDHLFLAGFSFGAAIALRVAPQLGTCGLVTVAPPVARIPSGFELPAGPWLIVHGARDELVPVESVSAWAAGLRPTPALVVIDGASHFFHGSLDVLGQHVGAFVKPLVPRSPANGEPLRSGGRGTASC